jgi:hypothetical protein
MRESRTYGSVRGARDETRVPTATKRGDVAHCTGFRMPAVSELGVPLGRRPKAVKERTRGRWRTDYGDLIDGEVARCWPCLALSRPMTWLPARTSM